MFSSILVGTNIILNKTDNFSFLNPINPIIRNKEAASQSQEYAKEMFDYTGYENQVKQMKAAGLNPALLNGGAGSAGQAHGATVSPATTMQPMGLQVALQAQQVANTLS